MPHRGSWRPVRFAIALAALAGACSTQGMLDPGGAGAGGSGGAGTTTTTGQAGAAGMAVAGSGGASAGTCAGGSTVSYLIRSLVSFERDGAGSYTLHGFDLDGRDSDGTGADDCGVADSGAPDGRKGIDNTIGGLWAEDLAPMFDASYAQGRAPIVLTLSGLDDVGHDDCVELAWSGAQWVGAPLDPASPQAAERQLRSDGSGARLIGRIDGGRLVAVGDAVTSLRAVRSDSNGFNPGFTLPLALSQVAFEVSAERLTHGELGGRVAPADVKAAYESAFGSLLAPGVVETILFRDLPSGPDRCALLSAGFGFEAVRVTMVP
jgi:hypothetical protein